MITGASRDLRLELTGPSLSGNPRTRASEAAALTANRLVAANYLTRMVYFRANFVSPVVAGAWPRTTHLPFFLAVTTLFLTLHTFLVLLSMVAEAQARAAQIRWGVDMMGTASSLLLVLLRNSGQQVRYASGRVVAAMGPAFAGEGKTDAKDAYV
jgi:Transposase